MKLIKCKIENTRRHKLVNIDFDPKITLIHGPNESGKSTIVEAMHRVLFLKSNSTGLISEKLRSKFHIGNPLVEIEFDAQGQIWNLSKRFSGQSGTTRIYGNTTKEYNGAAAEDLLAELLKVNEIVGSRKANNLLPKRWSHLWIFQGLSSRNILELGTEYYNLEGLVNVLEKKSEKLVQSAADQKIIRNLEILIDDNYTSRGIKRNSELWTYQQKFLKSEQFLTETKEAIKSLEESNSELDSIEKQILDIKSQIQPLLTNKLDELQSKKFESAKNNEQIKTLTNKIELCIKGLKEKRKFHSRLNSLKEQKKAKSKELEENERSLNHLELDLADINKKIKLNSNNKDNNQTKLDELENKGIKLKEILELLKLIYDKDKLNKLESQEKALTSKCQGLVQEEKYVKDLKEEEVELLYDIKRELKSLEGKIKSSSIQIYLERSRNKVSINGSIFKEGEIYDFIERAEILIDDDTKLFVHNKNCIDLNEINNLKHNLTTKYNRILHKYNVSDIFQLQEIYKRKLVVSTELKMLKEKISMIKESKLEIETNNTDLKNTTLDILNKEIKLKEETLSNFIQEFSNEGKLYPEQIPKIELCLESYREIFKTLRNKIETLQLENSKFENLRENMQRRISELISEVKVNSSEQKYIHEEKENLIHNFGSEESVSTQINEIKAKIVALSKQKKSLQSAMNVYDSNLISTEINKIKLEIERTNNKLQELSISQGILKERSFTISERDPYSELEQAIQNLEQSKTEYNNMTNLLKARIELLKLFKEAQLDYSNKYSKPISQAITNYLKPIVNNNDQNCYFDFDQSNGFTNLGLKQNSSLINFNDLSIGMKEQLNAAILLSMADVHKQDYDNSLPIIFDDAFTNTDPGRINSVLQMILKAADSGLQLIILSCNPDPYQAIANKIIKLE